MLVLAGLELVFTALCTCAVTYALADSLKRRAGMFNRRPVFAALKSDVRQLRRSPSPTTHWHRPISPNILLHSTCPPACVPHPRPPPPRPPAAGRLYNSASQLEGLTSHANNKEPENSFHLVCGGQPVMSLYQWHKHGPGQFRVQG